eukprot:gene15941-17964_t
MAWEVKEVKGTKYWSEVPPNFISVLHFYNAPISANYSETHSVLRQIDEVADEGDFVSFKLDVDTTSSGAPDSYGNAAKSEISQEDRRILFRATFPL